MANVPNGNHDQDRTGNRYAILVAGGNCFRRHLNDLEFCYRMLKDHYGFDPKDITVLYFHGKFEVNGNPQPTSYPDEGTNDPYKIKGTITTDRKGTGDAFRDAILALKPKLQADDLLFIHLNGHGHMNGGEAYLLEEGGGQYTAGQFCTHLGLLNRPYAQLLIMMEQCFSAGFITPVTDAAANGTIKAQSVSIACASSSYSGFTSDQLFNCFSKGWIAAHMNKSPWGKVITANTDTNGSGFIEADEAFTYGKSRKHAHDDPRQGNHPDSGAAAAQDIIRLA